MGASVLFGCERGTPASVEAPSRLDPTLANPSVRPSAAPTDAPKPRAKSLASKRLCPTLGTMSALGEVSVAKFRGTFPGSSGDYAALGFRYAGPTSQVERLGSGLERRQLGLKLRARDACNLVYVMWRLEPKAEVAVSLKRNAGASSSRDCGNRGYTNLRAGFLRPPPALEANSEHELAAEISGETLRVAIDGAKVWEGPLPESALELEGPPGVRSDNIAWTLVRFHAREAASPNGGHFDCPDNLGVDHE